VKKFLEKYYCVTLMTYGYAIIISFNVKKDSAGGINSGRSETWIGVSAR
jgi:hypothetical protein